MLRFKTKSITAPGAVYRQPETAYKAEWKTSFEDVLETIAEHRKAHGIAMPEGWEREVEHQMCFTLKVDNPDDWIWDPENPPVPYLVAYGRALWAELHARPLSFPERPTEQDKQNEIQWLEGWKARIPSAKCDCAYRWKKMGLDFDLSSREGYYRSTVVIHDRINQELGKPVWSGPWQIGSPLSL